LIKQTKSTKPTPKTHRKLRSKEGFYTSLYMLIRLIWCWVTLDGGSRWGGEEVRAYWWLWVVAGRMAKNNHTHSSAYRRETRAGAIWAILGPPAVVMIANGGSALGWC